MEIYFMKRLPQLLLALVGIIAMDSAPVSAQNIHNGYIAILNQSPHEMTVTTFKLLSNDTDEIIKIAPGKVGYLNKCCYAAGTTYRVDATYPPPHDKGNFGTSHNITPGLCNKNGIPHGFAWLVFRPTTIYGPYNALGHRWSYETPQLVEQDKTCTR